MKKKIIFIATFLVIVATAVAVVSCKKETTNALQYGNSQSTTKTFKVPEVDDMNAYLNDFKQKMQDSQYVKDDEMLSLEEAAWHLSSVANYDFANANVEFNDIRFDTLYHNVTVTEGQILMSDLAVAYENITSDIDRFYHELALENKHFRFIGVTISENGMVLVSLTTTFSNGSKWHYFTDGSFCDDYFSNNVQYTANDVAITALTNSINLIIGHNNNSNNGRIYYVVTRTFRFKYNKWYEDPDNYCPNDDHSRLYCSGQAYGWPIPKDHMCYYLDSYLGLAFDNITTAAPDVIQVAVHFWKAWNVPDGIREQRTGNHYLDVDYGIAMSGHGNEY